MGVMSLWDIPYSMEIPFFIMALFQSAVAQVSACLSSETDGRFASY